jgi:hypothetical protein
VNAAGLLSLDRMWSLAPLLRLREVVFAAACRAHLVWFDRVRAARAQLRTLLGLVHRARRTPFGRDHDFARVRTIEDYRRLVPLCTPGEMGRDQGARLSLGPELLAGHRQALRTALALVQRARPRANLLPGSILWLGDGTALAGDTRRFPALVRPSLVSGHAWDNEDITRFLAQNEGEPITCLAGPAERVSAFLEQSRRRNGNDTPCPGLVAVLYSRSRPGFAAEELRRLAGPRPLLLEQVIRPEAPFAVEDPRTRQLRLLADHGAFFEFVPADLADHLRPPRLGLDEVKAGIVYEVAVTSPAGWWACRGGLRVCFDQLSPPVLRVVPAAVPSPHIMAGPLRPRTAGSPAAPPEMSFHSPWSGRADRG